MDGNKKGSLISIITSTFNSSKFIEETIKSVQDQSHKNWEWHITDDCSTDLTYQILQRYASEDPRIKLQKLNKNFGGPARARNKGLEKAKGEYICFLDSDDIWIPEKLELQMKEIGSYDLLCSNYLEIDANSKNLKKINVELKNKILAIFFGSKTIYFMNMININSSMIKNSYEFKFSEEKDHIAIEDYIFWMKFLKINNNFKIMKQYLLKYRVHDNAISEWNSNNSHKKILRYFERQHKQGELPDILFLLIYTVLHLKMFFRSAMIILFGSKVKKS